MNLSRNGFTGDPLVAFFNCQLLKRLNLAYNKFACDFSTSSLVGLSSLELLYMNDNSVTGAIGSAICTLERLRFLNLSDNHLCGVLPADFGNLVNLELCVLSDNQITGPVPASMSRLTNLRDFHIFNQWPSEAVALPREHKSFAFKRLYLDSLSLHIDSLCWQQHGVESKRHYGEDDNPHSS